MFPVIIYIITLLNYLFVGIIKKFVTGSVCQPKNYYYSIDAGEKFIGWEMELNHHGMSHSEIFSFIFFLQVRGQSVISEVDNLIKLTQNKI